MKEYTPERITSLKENEIFVFGSNLQGGHYGGAARIALMKFGAIMGQGVGLQGQSYAIPTMQGGVETIKPYVDEFTEFAKQHTELKFLVTSIGCGIAGFKPHDIAPLFIEAAELPNVVVPLVFAEIIKILAQKPATKESWNKLLPMPKKNAHILLNISIPSAVMRLVKMGHIPETMDDHWFMYCDATTIRFYRSWTGTCVFVATYEDDGKNCKITDLIVNRDPEQCGLSDDKKDAETFKQFINYDFR